MLSRATNYLVLCAYALLTASIGAQALGNLRLATVENLPPFSFYEGGTLKGIDIDVVQELAYRMNMDIQIAPMPWRRVISELQAGTIDGAFSVYLNEERKQYCIYLEAVHYDNLGLVVKKGNEFTYTGIPSLYGKRIGKGIGVFISADFDSAVQEKKFTVEEINDTNMGNIQKLYLGRLDAVIGVVETMLSYARELGYGTQIVGIRDYIDKNRPGYLVISKKSPFAGNQALIERLKTEIRNIMSDGTYGRINAKYW